MDADGYLLAKTVHVLSATVLFGTGLGIAFFFLMGMRSGDDRMALFAARTTVIADMIFTLTAGVVQPATGIYLARLTGADILSPWLVRTYALYVLALACWLPVVWLQLRMRDMLAAKVAGRAFDDVRYRRYFRIWFTLGWPAFIALVAIVWLMVTKPV